MKRCYVLRIFKYKVQINDYFTINLPKDSKVLTVQVQMDETYMWVLFNPEFPSIKRNFRLVGTGHPIIEDLSSLRYVNTFQVRGGVLVFHLFELV